ncbi:MAG: hypothetical protein ACREQO_20705, partial [Candidatus Binatia bacterium]
SLAALEYFRWKNEPKNLQNAAASLGEERLIAQELSVLVAQAEQIFAQNGVAAAKEKVLALLREFPEYQKQFERQIRGQHAATVLEAKLSHDLAYYRYFDAVVGLAEKAPSLKRLIEDLKKMPGDATPALADKFLRDLNFQYSSTTKTNS